MKDPTADEAIARIMETARRQWKECEVDRLLQKVQAYCHRHGYTLHGKLSAVDDEGNCYFRHI